MMIDRISLSICQLLSFCIGYILLSSTYNYVALNEDFLTRHDVETQAVTKTLSEKKLGSSQSHSQESLGNGSTDSQTSLLRISQDSLDSDKLSSEAPSAKEPTEKVSKLCYGRIVG